MLLKTMLKKYLIKTLALWVGSRLIFSALNIMRKWVQGILRINFGLFPGAASAVFCDVFL